MTNHTIHFPLPDSEAEYETIAPEEEHRIVPMLEAFINDYGAIPMPHYALPIALWALGTHCFEKFHAFPYLTFTSTAPGAGKTRLLEVLECICSRARLKAKITLAGMCALIERDKPTLLIDQAERLSKNDHNDLMACILSGYRAGLFVTVQSHGEAVDRPIYCPKAFALLGDMLEAARDRSITIGMKPMRTRKRWFRPEAQERGTTIQKRCAEVVEQFSDEIDDVYAGIGDSAALHFLDPREEEIWTPLFVMGEVFCPERRTELEIAAADICAEKRAEPKRVAAREGKRLAQAASDGERLVTELLEITGPAVGVRTNDALQRLKAIHNAPWRNYAGEGLTDLKLADLVRPFGVAPRQFKISGKNLRGYLRADLEKAMRSVEGVAEPVTPLPPRAA
ncbi:MAG: DUF3631 domain-containing protein [Bryobacterales bacterium]|nr:DUF3631 domain-containing protein [Bryobacterales bacterium]